MQSAGASGNLLDAVWIIFARDGSIKYFGLNHNTKDDFKEALTEMVERKPHAIW